jgi:hypothetical protein
MRRRFAMGSLLGLLMTASAAWSDCAPRLEDARAAVKHAEAAVAKAKESGKAAARAPLAKGKKVVLHAEAECKAAGGDVKKIVEAGREAREAQGWAEEARLLAEKL